MVVLSKKQEIIITRFLLASGDVSSREIQKSCNLSRKTLTGEILQINAYLLGYGARIDTIKGKGYTVTVLNEQKYHAFREDFLHANQRNKYLYIEKNRLAYLILFDLMLSDGYVNIEELSLRHHYSRSIISRSIKIIRTILKKFHLHLVSRPNYGLKVVASEWSRRICILFFDKIAVRMSTIIPGFDNIFKQVLNREKYSIPAIELLVESVLRRNDISVPLSNLVKINLYIILTQTRVEYYDMLAFNETELKRIGQSRYLSVSRQIARGLSAKDMTIGEKDIQALTVLLASYATRKSVNDVEEEVLKTCTQDVKEMVSYICGLYPGIDMIFDDAFSVEFAYFLAGLKERILFKIPCDDEGVFVIKQDAAFMSDLSRDFASFYADKYGVVLSEAELLTATYILSGSSYRNAHRAARFRAAVVSRHGIHMARNVAERFLQQYRHIVQSIDAFEFTDVNAISEGQYHFIITDIEQKRYNFMSIPILKLDFFREPKDSRSIVEYFSIIARMRLKDILTDSGLIKDMYMRSKVEVFGYIAKTFVAPDRRQAFVEDCLKNDAYISFERCNRIVLISASAKYFDRQEIVILFNKTPFIWDNEPAQMFLLYKCKNKPYTEIATLNNVLISFMHSSANIAQELSQMDATAIIEYIVHQNYKKPQ